MTRLSRPGVPAIGALAAVLTLSLAACAPRESGAAAVVGDRRITVAEVQSAVAGIQPIVGQDQQVPQSTILNLLILEPFLTHAAAALGRGISATDAQLDIKAAVDGKNVQLSQSALEVWQANLASQALQSNRDPAAIDATYKGIAAQVKAAGVHINPRYGSGLDFTTLTILTDSPNWLKSSASPSASASPQPAQTPTEQPSEAPSDQPTAPASDQPAESPTSTP